jgi:hypothetical protein
MVSILRTVVLLAEASNKKRVSFLGVLYERLKGGVGDTLRCNREQVSARNLAFYGLFYCQRFVQTSTLSRQKDKKFCFLAREIFLKLNFLPFLDEKIFCFSFLGGNFFRMFRKRIKNI